MKKEHVIKLVLIGILGILIYRFGILAFFSEDPKNSGWFKNKIGVGENQYDVVVVGEEPEGIAAALSSARMGAKTLLIAEGNDLGGTVTRALLSDLEIDLDIKGGLLNRGILVEFYNKLGFQFSIQKYLSLASELLEKEKRKLNILYQWEMVGIQLDGNTLTELVLTSDGEEKRITGKRFIDATRDGELLTMCGVPYFQGSEDLNMKDSFLPIKLNFIIQAETRNEIKKVIRAFNTKESSLIDRYETSYLHLRFGNMRFIDQGDNTAVISGLEVTGIDVTKPDQMAKAYEEAADEAKEIVAFLKANSNSLANIEFVRCAESFYVKEKFHFAGLHTLSVNDILENTDFRDKVVLGSSAVDAGKLLDYNESIIGKPTLYTIPLRSYIPLNVNHVFMVGSKSSFSSLTTSSAGNLGTGIAAGEALGAAAVFSISKDLSPQDMTDERNSVLMEEFHNLLKKQRIRLDDFHVENPNTPNFSFSSLKTLRNIGLISGGYENNYAYSVPATQEDFAILLLNGVYRTSADQYTLALDTRIRKYFTTGKLTKNKAGEILASLYDIRVDSQNAYSAVIKRGFIPDDVQIRLNDTDTLNMEDVYVLTAYHLKLFTGKDLGE